MPVNSFENYPMTWKPDLKSFQGPLYKSLAQLLENDIRKKVLIPGTKLPPQRELADYLDINLSTVSRAFKICEQKGLICAAVGNGTYVSSDASANTILLSNIDEPYLIQMGAVLPNGDANYVITEYVQKMCLEPSFSKLFQFGMPNGTLFQREAGVAWIKKANYQVDSEDILLAGGAQNAITAVLASLFLPGDRIGTDQVVYPGIKTAAQMLGIQLVPIQQDDNEITEEGLIYAIKTEKIKGLYVIPDYHNPTTHTMSLEKRKHIGRIAKKNNLIIIEDAINSLLQEDPLPPIASFSPEQTVYISSLSKVIAPGLRLSFLTVPAQYKKKVATALYNINISVPPLLVEIASRLIHTGQVEKIIKERRAFIQKQNQKVDLILGIYMKMEGINACPFRWLMLPDNFTGNTFELYAKNVGVQVYSAERFAVGTAPVKRAVRIAVTATKDSNEFERGLRLLKGILEKEEELLFF